MGIVLCCCVIRHNEELKSCTCTKFSSSETSDPDLDDAMHVSRAMWLNVGDCTNALIPSAALLSPYISAQWLSGGLQTGRWWVRVNAWTWLVESPLTHDSRAAASREERIPHP